MNSSLLTIVLLIFSNTFMTFAWYGHLKSFTNKPIMWVVMISWSIAFFEYLLQIPANRIGYTEANFNLSQLKLMQEVISLSVFVPFAMLYMDQKITLNYLWAGFCLLGAVYFIFKPS
ncbi:DMT family protein [Legionella bononiensis]|uniref:DMT family protein n=1 Tax=Legionella bononiensis TaxID=2793102 RepID=A0ABS1WF38_9GAMM|nr:DMT family protein [Legionella bononiensis]MBL7479296.1 DMT family protein [Legionella bononiensis]MBL7527976.1 DMT family protein [Legionella bononiensis]MBL7563947.1 DMT family protein [Legionella bononiensis]